MNRAEAKILHGVYYHREMVGEYVIYSSAELNWLAHATFAKGANWLSADGHLQSLESPRDDYLAKIGATSAAAQRPLRYLEAAGYITTEPGGGGFRIAVTAKGADVARELHSVVGRLNILYRENKDGVLWLFATVLVSLITTLITNTGAG